MKILFNSLIVIVIVCFATTACNQQQGTLSGVVTYSNNGSSKADVGANIYVLKKSDYDTAKFKALIASQLPFITYSMIEPTKEMIRVTTGMTDNGAQAGLAQAEKNLAGLWSDLKSMGINSEEDFNKYTQEVLEKVNEFKSNSKSIVADGNGSYSLNLDPTDYFILFQSSGKKLGSHLTEGNFSTGEVKIEPGKESTANAKFQ